MQKSISVDGYELQIEYDENHLARGAQVLAVTGRGYQCIVPEMAENEIHIASIGKKAFLGLKSLREIVLPTSIELMGDYAFANCSMLQNVAFLKHDAITFGRNMFKGCDRLASIALGYEKADDASALLAVAIRMLNAEFLLHPQEVGTQSWYENFDRALLRYVNAKEDAPENVQTVCGEEDISYEPSFMVDGEMPDEMGDGLLEERMKKCEVVFARLLHPQFLQPSFQEELEAYIKGQRFREGGAAWRYLRTGDLVSEEKLCALYLQLAEHSPEEMDDLLKSIPQSKPSLRACVIAHASGAKEKKPAGSLFSDFML